MKPNKSYKALMVEIEVAEKIKKAKPDKMTMTEFLLKLLDKR